VDKKVNNFHDILSIVGIGVEVVDWEVQPKITGGVEAWSLKTRNLSVICLSISHLSSLVNIGSVIDSIRDVCVFP
jgi:hypothetical protein